MANPFLLKGPAWSDGERQAVHFWGLIGLLIGAIEILGAWQWLRELVGWDVPWNTISYTVGNLETRWHPSALAVVAVLVAAMFYGVAYSTRWIGGAGPGYSTVARAHHWALIVIIAVVIAVAEIGDASKLHYSYLLYGTIAVAGIVVPAVYGVFHPKEPTLFTAVRALWRRIPLARYLLATGLTVLTIHLALYPWPDYPHQSSKINDVSAEQAILLSQQKISNGLEFSTETRGVVGVQTPAWIVYFGPGCVVTVAGRSDVVPSAGCNT